MGSAYNDAVMQATGGPTYVDGLRDFYIAAGATGNSLNDLERSYLENLGATFGHVNDMWLQVTDASGYQGSVNDRQFQFWLAGGGGATLPTPTNLAASDGTGIGEINLSWTLSAGADTYDIRRDGVVIATGVVPTSYADNTYVNGQRHVYQVMARDSGGAFSPWSVSDTGWESVPGPPSNLAASTTDQTQVNITWTDLDATWEVASYTIDRSDTQFGGYSFLASVAPGVGFYQDTTIAQGDSKWYTIKCVNADGDGSSASAVEGTRPFPQTPDVPLNVQATEGTDQGFVTITWDTAARANDYAVYRDTILVQSSIVGLTYDDTGRTQSQVHSYTVAAKNTGGQSPQSAPDDGWDGVPLTAPSAVVAGDTSDAGVTVTWTDIGSQYAVSSYRIERGPTGGPYVEVGSALPGVGTFFDTSIPPDTSAFYVVRAANSAGLGPISAEDEGTRGVPEPAFT
jgi:fibronectin type 3 domain-containing protein